LGSRRCSLWLEDVDGSFFCAADVGYADRPDSAALLPVRQAADTPERTYGESREPFVFTPDEIARRLPELPPVSEPLVVAPLPLDGVRGWLTLRDVETLVLTEQRIRLLRGICYQTSVALQKAQLYREQKENAEIANALLEFGREIASAEGLDDVLARI